MRLLSGSIAALLLVLLGIGCNTVSPDECWPNTSGGFGGSGTIPIGAGVGVTTGGDFSEPPRGPLDKGGASHNPCVTSSDDTKPSDDTTSTLPTEMGTYIRCVDLDPMTCEAMCFDMGAQCSALAMNPDRPWLGVGKLKQCQRSPPGSTCTYCFEGPLSCTQLKFFGVSVRWMCNFPGGKGCE